MPNHLEPTNSLVNTDAQGQPTTTSLVVADGVNIQHKNVLELVRKHIDDFEEFGRVAFQTRVAGQSPNPTKFAVLNREHAMLLMTYMRNTEIVRDFKKRLIKAFIELEQRAMTDEMSELDEAKLVQRALQITYRQVKELEAANSEMAPKAAYYDEFVADEDLIQFRTLANQIGIQEKQLRETLIAKKWIYRIEGKRWSNKKNKIVTVNQYRAYAEKKHLFRLVPCHEAPRINGEVQQALKLTPRGVEAVTRLLDKTPVQMSLEGGENNGNDH
ncbi:Rha family transcriptional regulator [Corynebacterium cystitidis]|uniref:Rha family transcriptional regulator n=1 Tax=Corynebacterium cystitidis TaxID=35757 RepID=UPI00211DBAA9|nr:phage regulatory protein/antirepressor Ant [Corynebacterium cystitidis]